MLVLSRKKNEEIVILLPSSVSKPASPHGGTPQEVTICVVEIRGDKVRLGINASKETPVHRREVYDAILREGDRPKSVRHPSKSLTSVDELPESAVIETTAELAEALGADPSKPLYQPAPAPLAAFINRP